MTSVVEDNTGHRSPLLTEGQHHRTWVAGVGKIGPPVTSVVEDNTGHRSPLLTEGQHPGTWVDLAFFGGSFRP